MLFLIDVDIDYGRMGQDREHLLQEELKRSKELYEKGVVKKVWRKANARGAVSVWDIPDLEFLRETLATMPFYPYFADIRLTPLLAHPLFP